MVRKFLPFAFLVLAGCSSAAQITIDGPPRAKVPASDTVWTHTLLLTNPGSRSEGLREDLAYGGQKVPSSIGRLIALGYDWEYRPFTNAWTPWGWHIAGSAPSLGSAGDALSAKELTEGMAVAEGLSRRPGTPSNWVLAIRGAEHWLCDPAKLAALAKARGWTARE